MLCESACQVIYHMKRLLTGIANTLQAFAQGFNDHIWRLYPAENSQSYTVLSVQHK